MPELRHYNSPIEYVDRATGEKKTEAIFGETSLRLGYCNPFGRLLVSLIGKRAVVSRWYGRKMDRPASRKKVAPFVEKYKIDTTELLEPVGSYATFNEFFYRKLKPEARPIAAGGNVAVFPADGRHLAIDNVSAADSFYIKGQQFDLRKFIGDDDLAAEFAGGSMLISRLCPVDYHRFHFPVAGMASSAAPLSGTLRSVNPLALRRALSILWENRRERTLIESHGFGKVLVVEVGATMVGSIHQTYESGDVSKGDEKGYFSFGGSNVTTIFQAGAVDLDSDLLANTAQGLETFARMGEQCGVSA